jgi:hypothetical protein
VSRHTTAITPPTGHLQHHRAVSPFSHPPPRPRQLTCTTSRVPQHRIDRESRWPESTPGFFPSHHCRPLELLELEISAAELPFHAYKEPRCVPHLTSHRRKPFPSPPHHTAPLREPPNRQSAAARRSTSTRRPDSR